MEKFQVVLYYKKRVVIGGKASIDTMISTKKKFANFDEHCMDEYLDEYLDDKKEKGREEILNTWVLVYDDEDFIENILEIEKDESFVEWDERATEMIKQKILQK